MAQKTMLNLKAPGIDYIENFWLKRLNQDKKIFNNTCQTDQRRSNIRMVDRRSNTSYSKE
jgi:hypothetical protein